MCIHMFAYSTKHLKHMEFEMPQNFVLAIRLSMFEASPSWLHMAHSSSRPAVLQQGCARFRVEQEPSSKALLKHSQERRNTSSNQMWKRRCYLTVNGCACKRQPITTTGTNKPVESL